MEYPSACFSNRDFYGAGLEKLIAYAVSVGRAEKEDIFYMKKLSEIFGGY